MCKNIRELNRKERIFEILVDKMYANKDDISLDVLAEYAGKEYVKQAFQILLVGVEKYVLFQLKRKNEDKYINELIDYAKELGITISDEEID